MCWGLNLLTLGSPLKDAHCVSDQLLKLAFSWVSWAAASSPQLLTMHPLGITNICGAGGYADSFAATCPNSASSSGYIADATGMQTTFLSRFLPKDSHPGDI